MFVQGLYDGTIIPQPKALQHLKILDIYLKWDEESEQVILLALMENGVVSSFQIEKNYQPLDAKKMEKPQTKKP